MDKQKSSVHIIQGTRRIWEWSCLACHHQWKDNTTQDGRLWQGGCRVWPEVPALEPKLWGQGSLHRILGTWFWPAFSCWIDLIKGLPSLDFRLVTHVQPLDSGEHLSLTRAQWAWAPSAFLNSLLVFSHAVQIHPRLYLLLSVWTISPQIWMNSLKLCSSNPLAAKAVLEWKLVVRGKKKQIFVASSSEGGFSPYNSLTTWRQNAFQRPVCLCFLQWGGWITEHVSIPSFAQSGLWAWWLVGTELTLWPGKATSRTAAGGQNSSSSILPPVQYVHKLLPSEEFSGLA